ncbi:MAG: winged helix-turn-helix transcriptional regulator [Tissierellia bacterium]|nr:winged helix-turn-helix transcriptional regulator [Tissierellia bacterium]
MTMQLIKTDISQLTREISRKLDTILLPVSDENNLTIMKLKVLAEIHKNKKMTIVDLGNVLGVAGGNISNMCKTLEIEGYIERKRSVKDERVVHVSLTSKGKSVLANVNKQLSDKYEKFDKQIPKEDIETIISGLNMLNGYLDELLTLR